ncbi:hypothetical protein [Cohaesibacter gelatinilyticus]|uniref:Uncharacterized protein n=1 Tax=Cohaesibacter gelatinilyticus TaxID=372072 RepID=A0A285PEF8_9HYPH|nr:hypothetical protein [Cohaesibacter gelatinilyticus]SNZ20109.1 hypothetical protein SAMN06265368_3210 [Cohaesibacter gelatinilyticus]
MALGQVSQNKAEPERFVEVIGHVEPGTEEAFWRDRIFSKPSKKKQARKHWYRSLALSFLARLPGRQSKLAQWIKSLTIYSFVDILNLVTDRVRVGSHYSERVWEVSFHNFFLVSARQGICGYSELALETSLAKHLSSSVSGYVDPEKQLRIRCMVSNAFNKEQLDEVHFYLGSGVHAPLRGEKPIGWLRFYPNPTEQPANFTEPLFLDGAQAAIFNGQSMLYFGLDGKKDPVFLNFEEAELAGHYQIWIAGRTELEAEEIVAPPQVEPLSNERASLIFKRPNESITKSLPADIDARWNVSFIGLKHSSNKVCRMDMSLDGRPSRLYYRRPAVSHVAITQLAFSRTELANGELESQITKFWFDFDGYKRLIFSAMQKRRYSLSWTFSTNRHLAFDWHANRRYHWSASWNRDHHGDHFLEVLQDPDDPNMIRIKRSNNQPFGYLTLPTQPEKLLFFDDLQTEAGFHLDWLDHAGAVQIGNEVLGLGKAFHLYGPTIGPVSMDMLDKHQTLRLGPFVIERWPPN